MTVTAAILNFDGRALLDVAVPSVLAQRGVDVRVVVVDDGSSDGSVAHVRERWPEVEVVALAENAGVSAVLNRAVDAARGHSELVALLNNDLELEADWLAALVATLEAHPEAASVTGKMLRFDDRARLDGAGDAFMWSSAATRRGFLEPDDGRFDAPGEVFSPCAGAAVYRLEALDDVGPFDEDFFAYLEDVDWGFRAQLRGWTSRYEPRAVCFHMGSATTSRRAGFFGELQRRNQLVIVLKDYPARALARHAPKIVLHHLGWVVASVRDGVLPGHGRALAAVARGLPRTLRKRRAVQASRRVPLARLEAIVSPELSAGQSPRQRARSMLRALRGNPRLD